MEDIYNRNEPAVRMDLPDKTFERLLVNHNGGDSLQQHLYRVVVEVGHNWVAEFL